MKTIRYFVTSLLAVALFILASGPSLAAKPATALVWDAPTQFVDGSELTPLVDLSGYEIACDGVTYLAPVTSNLGEVLLFDNFMAGQPDGVFTCEGVSVAKDGTRSPPSNTSQEVTVSNGSFFLATSGTPQPPGSLSVQ